MKNTEDFARSGGSMVRYCAAVTSDDRGEKVVVGRQSVPTCANTTPDRPVARNLLLTEDMTLRSHLASRTCLLAALTTPPLFAQTGNSSAPVANRTVTASPSVHSTPTRELSASTAETWYGWQTRATDGAAVAIIPAPGVHSEHGHVKTASNIVVSSEFARNAEPGQQPRTTEATWYGWQVLIADVATVGLTVTAANTDASDVLIPAAFGNYLLAAPVIHAAHGNWGRAGLSLGVRTVIPVATGGIFYAASRCDPPSTSNPDADPGWCFDGVAAAFGAVLGAVVASAVDSSAIAWKRQQPAPTIAPTLGVTKTAAWLGVAGQF